MVHTCDFCDSTRVGEVVYEESSTVGRRKVTLIGLRKMVCANCQAEYSTADQLDSNHAVFEAMMKATPEAVTSGLLRTLRFRWGLTQRAASSLFGAGDSSFGKWESGKLPSGPAALLLQCASHVPGVMEYLARLRNTPLPRCPELADWKADGEVTGVIPVRKITPLRRVPLVPAKAIVKPPHYSRDPVEMYGEAA